MLSNVLFEVAFVEVSGGEVKVIIITQKMEGEVRIFEGQLRKPGDSSIC